MAECFLAAWAITYASSPKARWVFLYRNQTLATGLIIMVLTEMSEILNDQPWKRPKAYTWIFSSIKLYSFLKKHHSYILRGLIIH